MTKKQFQQEMRNLASEEGFEWSEENEDNFIWDGKDNYVAIWITDEDDQYAVESEDYTQTFDSLEGAKEDFLSMMDVVLGQESQEE